MHLTTRAVHAGAPQSPEPGTPTTPPIHPSTTFDYPSLAELDAVAGGASGYMYTRHANPTVAALERAVAELEEAETAVAFGSGMAAVHAAVLASGVRAGEVVVCSQDVYGGTVGLLRNVLAPLGVVIRFADFTRPADLDEALSGPRVRLVMAESLSNPLLRVLDIPQVAAKAHAAGAQLLVDATFTTPVLLRALSLGADFSLHSATKYLSGHGDALGGVVAVRAHNKNDGREALESVRKYAGGALGPFGAWLILRGLRTLPLRVERQCANAARVAAFLRGHAALEHVVYPGFADHPDHALARRQFAPELFGAMIAFQVKGARKADIFALIDRLRLCRPGTSLGDVQTLVMYPPVASHRVLPRQERERLGIAENLLRLSVGIEDPADITEDWHQALAGCGTMNL